MQQRLQRAELRRDMSRQRDARRQLLRSWLVLVAAVELRLRCRLDQGRLLDASHARDTVHRRLELRYARLFQGQRQRHDWHLLCDAVQSRVQHVRWHWRCAGHLLSSRR